VTRVQQLPQWPRSGVTMKPKQDAVERFWCAPQWPRDGSGNGYGNGGSLLRNVVSGTSVGHGKLGNQGAGDWDYHGIAFSSLDGQGKGFGLNFGESNGDD
jgi:hypothetical protein